LIVVWGLEAINVILIMATIRIMIGNRGTIDLENFFAWGVEIIFDFSVGHLIADRRRIGVMIFIDLFDFSLGRADAV
jgi:hypothetical protein